MKEFLKIQLDRAQCRKEIERFKALLDSSREFSERHDLQPLFKDCQQLAAFIGMGVSNLGLVDRLAYEFLIFGDFSADIVVGNSATSRFCAIELEDARPNSIFNKVDGRATTEWGRRFERGFSQMVD